MTPARPYAASVPRVRLLCLILCLAVIAPGNPLAFKGLAAVYKAISSEKTPKPGAPGPDLPDLNQLQHMQPTEPRPLEPAFAGQTPASGDGGVQTVMPGSLGPTPRQAVVRPFVEFSDVPVTHPYYSHIQIMSDRSITSGCGGGNYCPTAPVTREQMAAFIIRALHEPGYVPPPPAQQRFQDVPPSNPFYAFIEEMAVRQITAGCSQNPPLYCPTATVTREQMVTFLERAVGRTSPPTPGSQRFTDVPPSNIFYNFIDSFARHGSRRAIMDVIKGKVTNPTTGARECSTTDTLFCPGKAVTRDEMAALIIIAFGFADSYSAPARADVRNRIGQPGEDLLSGNYSWGLPLVGLPGRSGLDLGLGLSYNSTVWTKVNSSMVFDADNGSPGPGFRLGFPVIQQQYTSQQQAGAKSYLLVLPSGHRVELRQEGASSIYKSADSSYLKFDSSLLKAWTPDGTQLQYALSNNEYRCTQVKDRNGNYITVSYNTVGNLTTITDTLGRVFTFNYGSNDRLTSISQTRGGSPYTLATFSYTDVTLQTNFPGLAVLGPTYSHTGQLPAPRTLNVLTRVTLDDGSRYDFEYNSWGQVTKIRNYAADGHELNQRSYNLPADHTVAQTDCPRFTARTDKAENWLGGITGTGATSTFALEPSGAYGQVTAPDNTTYKATFHTSGWRRGLVQQSEVLSASVQKKRTEITWTQDNTSVSYWLNPRPTETNVYDDASNRRRTAIAYTTFTLTSAVNLPTDVTEYAANASTVLRHTQTDYGLMTNSAYTSRWVLGLATERRAYSGAGTTNLVSKVDYLYDSTAAGFLVSQGAPVQHDGANYGATFIVGRGNLTSMRRWDVGFPTDAAKAVEHKTAYNTTGAAIFTRDPLSHQTTLSYTDAFAGTGPYPTTLAYPTTITDADGFASTVQYDYDLGVVRRTRDPKGAVVKRTYDAVGRLERVDSTDDVDTAHGYTRYVYPTTQTSVWSYSLLATGAAEFFAAQIFDGAGRVIGVTRHFPGSVGGYSGQQIEYDNMGRVSRQSNPTEMNNDWAPMGDDAAAGWKYTEQQYDWQGRPTLTTNTDSTTRRVEYGGCGCAGGEVVTVIDEVDRRQKMTYDVLGRLWKVEVLNPAPGYTVYSTTTHTYNARDQITNLNVRQGVSGTGQDTVMTYDGHGRLRTRREPIQDATAAPTTYEYYADDTLKKMTDPRDAGSEYFYNARHLVTQVNYFKNQPAAPSEVQAIPDAPAAAFGYDAAGNRLWMTDGRGRVDYVHDTWSQLTSETRTFTGITPTFQLAYAYNLAGQLTSITDPFSAAVTYQYDHAGQMLSVNNGTYASGMKYRAWGAMKEMTYGNGLKMTQTYDVRLRARRYELRQPNNTLRMGSEYQYYGDGRVSFARDLTQTNSTLDRAYIYDQAGRVVEARTGSEARGGSTVDGPYLHSYFYDEWDNLLGRTGRSGFDPIDYEATYSNNRNTVWDYDRAGNLKDTIPVGGGDEYTYDSANRLTQAVGFTGTVAVAYSGDSQEVRRNDGATTRYYVRSSVLGGRVVSEVNSAGQLQRGHLYAGGAKLARIGESGGIKYEHRDPASTSLRRTNSSAAEILRVELDPLGVQTGLSGGSPPPPPLADPFGDHFGDAADADGGCYVDGVSAPCGAAIRLLSAGAVERVPQQSGQWRRNPQTGKDEWVVFKAFADGTAGYYVLERGRYINDDAAAKTDADGTIILSVTWKEGHWRQVARVASFDFLPLLAPAGLQSAGKIREQFRDYAVDLSKNKDITDCEKLARLILKAGDLVSSSNRYRGGDPAAASGAITTMLLTQLTEIGSLYDASTRSDPDYRVGVFTRDPYYGGGFRDSGFKSGYQDSDHGNQVRHFIGWFAAGYVTHLRPSIAEERLYRAEGTRDTSDPDVALGLIGIELGGGFLSGNYKQLSEGIRRKICD